MKQARPHARVLAGFLLLSASAPLLAFAQDLPRAEAERLSRLPSVHRAEDGRELPTPERTFRDPNVVPGRLLVQFVPGTVRMQRPDERVNPARLSERDLTERVPSQALRGLLRAEAVQELRQTFSQARAGERQRVRVDGWEVDAPDLSNHFVLELPAQANLEAVAQRLERLAEVVSVEPDGYISTHEVKRPRFRVGRPDGSPWLPTSSDPYFSLQHGLEQPNDVDIDAEAAWNVQTSTPSVRLAIIDTGVDYTHPDLGGAMATGFKVAPGWDYASNDGDPTDGSYHGTHVAGIAAALTNNLDASGQSLGIAGVAGGWGYNAQTQTGNRGATIVPMRVIPGTSSMAADAVYAAANPSGYNANVLNNSYGLCVTDVVGTPSCQNSTTLEHAMRYAAINGRVIVASSGNREINANGYSYPASYHGSWMTTVGASNKTTGDRESNWGYTLNGTPQGSTYGTFVDVTAPGTDIYSTMPGQSYDYDSGTSMAAPHVSGIAALLVQ